jgi:hypothetical protein
MKASLLIAALLAVTAPAFAAVPPGLFPPTVTHGGVELVRKGQSQLTVGYIFKVYHAAYYALPETGPDDVLADLPRYLNISYLRSISRDALIEAADDMLAQQHDAATIERIRPGLDAINALYQGVGKGDAYALAYLPGVGTELKFNGVSKGVIPGEEFARIYFSIWLGEGIPYRDFRDRLVGLK